MAMAGCLLVAIASTQTAYACTVSLGHEFGTVDAAKVAGNCGLATQQLVLTECGVSTCMQQLCAPFACCGRQIPNGAIISATRKMAIAARWKELHNMQSDYHCSHYFR
jgi:hypothetical protein